MAQYGLESFIDRNMRLNVKISGVPYAGFKVSGTKVEIAVSTWGDVPPIVPGSPPPPPFQGNPWNAFQVESVQLYIAGQEVVLPQAFGLNDPYSKGVRFASTHFPDPPDGPDAAILAIARIRPLRMDSEGNVLESGQLRELSVTVMPDIYNKAGIFGIKAFEIDGSPDWRGCPETREHLVSSQMNHTAYAYYLQNWTRAIYQAQLGPATVGYVNSHGAAYPFFQDDDPTGGATVEPNDILPYRVAAYDGGYPRMNLVVLDACSTGMGTDGTLNNSFAMAYLYPINDYVNVDQSLLAWRVDVVNYKTDVFAHYFWWRLAEGDTANEARDVAVVAKGVTDRVELARNFMACFGDYYTTLVGVYTGNDEASPSQWYLVL